MMKDDEIVEVAYDVLSKEIDALTSIREGLGKEFVSIVKAIEKCKGKCVLCGMGKSGHIAKKVAATLASLGTPALFLHPSEAMHGDLGVVSGKDVVIILSNSGETPEILALIPSLKLIGATIVAIVGNNSSSLAKECDLVQCLDIACEAGKLNLAPTVSTTGMLAYGDALAITLSEISGFTKSDFAKYHPAGTLGKKVLLKVKDIMAVDDMVPKVVHNSKISEAIMEMSKKGLGVVAITDEDNKLVGLLTDGDLRRAIESKADLYGDVIDSIMTVNPKSITEDILLVDVLEMLKESHLNNYPVVDEDNSVVGMITWQMIIRERLAL